MSASTPTLATGPASAVQPVLHAGTPGIRINAAVTDAGGALAAFLRIPGAFPHSVELAIDKAYAAASFGLRTSRGWPRWPRTRPCPSASCSGRAWPSSAAACSSGCRPEKAGR